jgi:DNA topoisomerase IB
VRPSRASASKLSMQQVEHDMARHGLPRAKVLATVLQLLETTLIRVGNEEYARTNYSFGLTTLRDHHVDIAGATLRFRFRAKSGKEHTVEINDQRLALIVKRCQEIPGQELFQTFIVAALLGQEDEAVPLDHRAQEVALARFWGGAEVGPLG